MSDPEDEDETPTIDGRSYPQMLALLAQPVPLGSAPLGRSAPARGLFRRSPPRAPRPEVAGSARLTPLVEEMAEGLLIGSSDQGSEMRIVLSDTFFRGTELRIMVERGQVTAVFSPPDYETYRQLSASRDALREHLSSRGLAVGEIEVRRP